MRPIYEDIPQPFNRVLGPNMYRGEYKREEMRREQMTECPCEEPPRLDRQPPHVPPCEEPHRQGGWVRPDRRPPVPPPCEEPRWYEETAEAANITQTEQNVCTCGNQCSGIVSLLVILLLLQCFCGESTNCF